MIYTRQDPSPRYEQLLAQHKEMHDFGSSYHNLPPEKVFPGQSLLPHVDTIKFLLANTDCHNLLDYGCGKGRQYEISYQGFPSIASYWDLDSITKYDPCYTPYSQLPTGKYDAVICTDVLEHCPEEDIPWIIDELFSYANKLVFANVACYPAKKRLPNGNNAHATIQPSLWWRTIINKIAARYPSISYEFQIQYQKLGSLGVELAEEKVTNMVQS